MLPEGDADVSSSAMLDVHSIAQILNFCTAPEIGLRLYLPSKNWADAHELNFMHFPFLRLALTRRGASYTPPAWLGHSDGAVAAGLPHTSFNAFATSPRFLRRAARHIQTLELALRPVSLRAPHMPLREDVGFGSLGAGTSPRRDDCQRGISASLVVHG